MIEFFSNLMDKFGKQILDLLKTVASILLKVMNYVENRRNDKIKEEERKIEKQLEKDIKKVADKGTIEDLLDLKRISVVFIMTVILCGCVNNYSITVDMVKPWEGHYFKTEDFNEATKDIRLEKGESIWVLSNNTLNRVLNNLTK